MAKTINLTVQVDDSQFQKFVRDYNAFAGQIKTLNVNFNAVTTTINKANRQSLDWLNTVRLINPSLIGIVSGVSKITTHFSKWAALIGGISMMLGTGAGLFGIDRLANSLIQRRRQVMGLGGDWGRIQAAQLGSMATITDPMSVMQRIQFAKMGDVLTRAGLQTAGISMKDITDPNKGPADLYEQVIRNMPQYFKRMQPGQELQFITGTHLDKVMPIEEWMKFIKPGGGLNIDEQQRVLKGIEERKKKPGLTPEEGRSWADLYEAAKSFVMDIQTKLGSALSGVAGSMTEVSKGFSDLVDALLDSPAVKRALNAVKVWLDDLATYLKSDEAKKKLEEWTEEMGNIPWAKLGETIGTFIEHLGTVIRALLALKGVALGAGIGAAVGGPIGGVIGGVAGGLAGWYSPELLQYGIKSLGGGTTTQGDPNAPANFDQRFGDWRTKNWWGGGGWVPHPSMFNQNWWQQPPTFPVNPLDPNATVPPAATQGSQQQNQQQGAVESPTRFAGDVVRRNQQQIAILDPLRFAGRERIAALETTRFAGRENQQRIAALEPTRFAGRENQQRIAALETARFVNNAARDQQRTTALEPTRFSTQSLGDTNRTVFAMARSNAFTRGGDTNLGIWGTTFGSPIPMQEDQRQRPMTELTNFAKNTITPMTGSLGGATTVSAGGSNPGIISPGGGAGGGGNVFTAPGGGALAAWGNATRSVVPTERGGGWASMVASSQYNFGPGAGKGGRGRGGALDIDNWQMNRTAQLRIDNIAGANIYSMGVGMG